MKTSSKRYKSGKNVNNAKDANNAKWGFTILASARMTGDSNYNAGKMLTTTKVLNDFEHRGLNCHRLNCQL